MKNILEQYELHFEDFDEISFTLDDTISTVEAIDYMDDMNLENVFYTINHPDTDGWNEIMNAGILNKRVFIRRKKEYRITHKECGTCSTCMSRFFCPIAEW